MKENVEKSASALPRRLRMFYGVGEFGQQLVQEGGQPPVLQRPQGEEDLVQQGPDLPRRQQLLHRLEPGGQLPPGRAPYGLP